ncbi:MAG: ribulose-phosphate 3-epimerase [Tannerellaceae bacterium]|jgi:ribulose-phosphate 3-epimerase|nr:ribulose-phosphate 3-epimerase [Tannerellaceae bacterium]
MNDKIKISASLACADMLNLEREVRLLERAGIDLLHIDIMDGIFVPNYGLNMDIMRALKRITDIPMECHLMIHDPERYIERITEAGGRYLSVHYEATLHIQRALALIRRNNMKAGVALNPATSIEVLDYIADDIDFVNLMMINPGFAGQKLIPAMIRKISDTRKYLDRRGKEHIDILVDGNVSIDNIPSMVEAGATILVGGTSGIFRKNHSIEESVELVRTLYHGN